MIAVVLIVFYLRTVDVWAIGIAGAVLQDVIQAESSGRNQAG